MPIDVDPERIRKTSEEREKAYQQKYEYFRKEILPKICAFLKENRGYAYTKKEIMDLFPESREHLERYFSSDPIERCSGIYKTRYLGASDDTYTYDPVNVPGTKEYRKAEEEGKRKLREYRNYRKSDNTLFWIILIIIAAIVLKSLHIF